jgi:hypothetical protein
MSYEKTSLNAQFTAFLLWNLTALFWNALNHAKASLTRSIVVVVIRWRATRERYEVKLWQLGHQIRNSPDIESIGVSLFELIIVIFIVGALIGNVANATTGITIAHTGFTPNPNLTASPGAVPLTQLFPLVFIAVGLMAAFDHFKRRGA